MSKPPRLVMTLGLVAGIVLFGTFAVRYTQSVNDSLRAPPAGTVKIQFQENPVPLAVVTFRTTDGRTMSTRDWLGKVAIVNFWATWCHPCRIEIPDLIKLQDRYRDRLIVVGISAEIPGVDLANDERSTGLAKSFATAQKINYPIVMQTSELLEAFRGIFAMPTSFVIDPQGRIVQKHVGLVNPAILEQEILALAGLPISEAGR
jgi:thiol-disulfide isomerase/thioredoxin